MLCVGGGGGVVAVLGSAQMAVLKEAPDFLPIPGPTQRLHSLDNSGQITNRAGLQPHSSADRLHNVFLSPESSKHAPWFVPAQQRNKTQLHPQVSRNWSEPGGSLNKPLRQPNPVGGRQQK